MKIKIDHIAKIEGHAGFVGSIVNGKTKKAQIEVQEGARLIESLLIGRNYNDVPVITSRICGLCPVIHNITSIKALEKALNVKPAKETILLRELMICGQIIQSHVLHIFFLSASDFFKKRNGLNLSKEKPFLTKKVFTVRKFGNDIIKLIGGRSIHPLTPKVGGWHKIPTKEILENIRKESKKVLSHCKDLIDFVSCLDIPKFERETEYIAYCAEDKYFGYEGLIKSSKNWTSDEVGFRNSIEERQESGTVVKLAFHKGKGYSTNALARLHLNSENLNCEAKKVFNNSSIKIPIYNPFFNILAQSIEVMHLVEESYKISEILINMKWTKNINTEFEIKRKITKKEGEAILEAPRGILYHGYKIDDKGIIIKSDIITPTAQLIVNLNEDLKKYLPELKNYSKKRIELEILKLVHSYDPCISCSVH